MDSPSSVTTSFEYGIVGTDERPEGYLPDDFHRSGMTESEADTWMIEWVQMTGRRAPFRVVRRPVGAWEPVA